MLWIPQHPRPFIEEPGEPNIDMRLIVLILIAFCVHGSTAMAIGGCACPECCHPSSFDSPAGCVSCEQCPEKCPCPCRCDVFESVVYFWSHSDKVRLDLEMGSFASKPLSWQPMGCSKLRNPMTSISEDNVRYESAKDVCSRLSRYLT